MTAIAATTARPAGAPIARRLTRLLERFALPVFTTLAVSYLLIPIAIMLVFSFNEPAGKYNFIWNQPSTYGWLHPLQWPGLPDAIGTTLVVAAASTLVATTLGTLMALSLTRYRFRGRGVLNGLIFLPMATPEIVMGASLLTLFVSSALPPLAGVVPQGIFFPLGLPTILIAHIMFNISYVVVTVKARVAGFDRHLEEAAQDLGANEWATFWRVTFPLIFPGILAAGLLAFSLSIDDFVITSFVSGTTNTFPIWTWSIIKNALPVQINVVGSIVFLSAVGFVVVSTFLQRRGR
ncbi:MAG TPA: ABC transporter permease [Candidatus Limnocylindrales bacterium]